MSFDAGAVIGKAILDTTQWVAGSKLMQSTMKNAGGAFRSLGKMAAGATLAFGAAISASVVKTNEWSKELANVSTLVDTSVVDVRAMGEEILNLDPKLGSATELTKGLYQALSASVEPAQAVMAVGESAKFARAALIDTNTAVDVGTTLINAYGQGAEQITPAFDKLFTVIKLGKTTGQELSSVIGQSIPLAANMGISFDELGASIAIMTRQGINAANATTQFNAVVNAFLKPSAEMEKTLKGIGFESGSAAIESLGFKGALDAVVKSAGGSKEELAGMFKNTRALRGVMALTGEGAKDFDNILEEMSESTGATNEAFEKQELTFEALMGTIDRLMIQVGQIFIPIVYDVVEGLTEFTQKLADNESFMTLLSFSAEALGFAINILADIVLFFLNPLGDMVEFFGDAITRGKKLNTSIADNSKEVIKLTERLDSLNAIENKNAETKEEIEKVTARLIELLPDSEEGFLAEADAVKASVTQLARRELILKNEELKAQVLKKIQVIEKDIAKAEKDLAKKQKELNDRIEEGGQIFQEFSEAELELINNSEDLAGVIEQGPEALLRYGDEIDKAAERVDDLKTNLDNTKNTLKNVENALIDLASGTSSAGQEFDDLGDKGKGAASEIEAGFEKTTAKALDVVKMRQAGELQYFEWITEQEKKLEELKDEQHEKEMQQNEEKIEAATAWGETISGYLQPVLESLGEALITGASIWDIVKDAAKNAIADILVALGQEAAVRAAINLANPFTIPIGLAYAAASAAAFIAAGVVRALQAGGPVSANEMVLVGEDGPELFMPDTAGTIIPNGQTNNMLNNSGMTMNNYYNVNNTSDAELVSMKLANRIKSQRRSA